MLIGLNSASRTQQRMSFFCYEWRRLPVSYACMTQLFLLPSMVTLAISSTRLYRSLANFSLPPDSYDLPVQLLPCAHHHLRHFSAQDWECPQSGRSITNNKTFSKVPSNRLEVTVHKAYEEHPRLQTDDYVSYPSSNVHMADKPHEIHFDDNSVEDPVEKQVDRHVSPIV